MKQFGLFTIAAALGMSCGHAIAGQITPVSYAYTNSTPAGDNSYPYSYPDSSGNLLTDGILGSSNPTDGTWVLWQVTTNPQITFTFASVVTIDLVSMDMLIDSEANTYIPESVTIDGDSVSPDNTLVGDPISGFVNYTGSWTGESLVIDLGHDADHWSGISEVEFFADSGNTAPEPASFILFGAAFIAIGGIRYRRQTLG